jgi:coenzyme F420-reducing hydrogenase delta subunit
MPKFEPKILAFACNWCSYAGADLAGVSRIQYPPNMRIIRVMCSGRVDPIFILDALARGVDGVMVLGCHPGDCHYISGNLMTERKIKWVKELIEKAQVDPNRLKLEWISASEGDRFANTVREFTEHVKKLGPIAGDEKDRITDLLEAAKNVASNTRLRILMGKEKELVEEGNVYSEMKSQAEFNELMQDAIDAEFTRNKILQLAADNPQSVKEIAKQLDIPSWEIGKHVMWLRHKGKIALYGIEGHSPLYKTVEVPA